jgi:hypothetical protein
LKKDVLLIYFVMLRRIGVEIKGAAKDIGNGLTVDASSETAPFGILLRSGVKYGVPEVAFYSWVGAWIVERIVLPVKEIIDTIRND